MLGNFLNGLINLKSSRDDRDKESQNPHKEQYQSCSIASDTSTPINSQKYTRKFVAKQLNIRSHELRSNEFDANYWLETNTPESNKPESNTPESNTVEPGTVEPGTVESGTTESGTTESNVIKSNTIKLTSSSVSTATLETASFEENTLQAEATEVFIRQAKAYMHCQDWDRAIAACEQALAVAPDLAQAHKRIGNLLQEMGRGIDSMGHYARALLANPQFPEVYANLGSLYARQQAWEDAEIYYRKAIALCASPLFYRPLIKVLEAAGKPQEATQVLVQRLALEPQDATAIEYYRAGNLFLEQGQEREAIASYRKAIEKDSQLQQAYRPLADLLEKQGDWQAATLYYRKVLESELSTPKKAKTPISLGELLQQSNQLQIAKPQTTSGNRVSANLSPTRATATTKSGETARIVDQTDSTAAATAEHYARVGQLQAQKKNWQRAIADYRHSLRIQEAQPSVHRALARALTQAGQLEAAAQAWYRSLELEPDWATAGQYFHLGKTLLGQSQRHQAGVCFRQAIQRRPQFYQAYEQLGRVLELQRDPAGAMVAYRRALETRRNDTAKK